MSRKRTRKRKRMPRVRYSKSDRLAIVLASLAGIMAIALFLIEKTPWSVGILTALMIFLSIYPILHFFKAMRARIAVAGIAVLACTAFGWKEWPEPSTGSADDCPPGTGICMIGTNNQGSDFESLNATRGIMVKGNGSSLDNALAITGTLEDYAVSVGKTEDFISQMNRYTLRRWKSLPYKEQQKKISAMEDLEKRIRAVEGNPDKVAPLLHQFANL